MNGKVQRKPPAVGSGELSFGIYCTETQLQSQPLKSLISILRTFRKFHVVELSDFQLRTVPMYEWVHLDCLLVLFSTELDLTPITQYISLHNPYLINDVNVLPLMEDRSFIYQTLEQNGINAPPYWVVRPEDDVQEFDDYLVINEIVLTKPYIEKPLQRPSHKLSIYYPSETGRGCTMLDKENHIRRCEYLQGENRRRRDQDYIYQPFLQTDGLDIRIYAIGVDYFHAEAHKSPVIHTLKVSGRAKKYPVMLTAQEKDLAVKVVKAFSQSMVTFDVIRSEGKSYVIDVNPIHIVKGPDRVIRECARTLSSMVLRLTKRFGPEMYPLRPMAEEPRQVTYRQERLCALVGIFRHGDRTPKQKVKLKTSNPSFLGLFERPVELKFKRHEDLQRLLDVTKSVLKQEGEANKSHLEMMQDVLEQGMSADYTPKAQIKPLVLDEEREKVTKALVILKWGGHLTHAGVTQCERLGKYFRTAYYHDDTETFHRLHSTYEHDIKCYSSSEGRCQKSAGALLRGLLDLDSDINAVATCMVRKDAPVVKMLDDSPPAADSEMSGTQLIRLLNTDEPMSTMLNEYREDLPKALFTTAERIGNPKQHLLRLLALMEELLRHLESTLKLIDGNSICGGESQRMIYQRWVKMYNSFYQRETGQFDIGRIPELNDCIRYDILHNRDLVGSGGRAILDSTRFMSKLVSNLEYGFTQVDKMRYCSGVIQKLMKKIWADLRYWMSAELPSSEDLIEDQNYIWFKPVNRQTRTRLYFTSLSHLNSILAIVSQCAKKWPSNSQLDSIMSLEYLGHFVLKLYEDEMRGPFDPKRYRGELWMSPGVNLSSLESIEQHTAPITPGILLHKKLRYADLEEIFTCAVGRETTK